MKSYVMSCRKYSNEKKKSMKAHFEKRVQQRIGEQISQKEIVRSIKANQLTLVEKQSNRVMKYRYIHNGINYIVCYDKLRSCLITVLYEDQEQYYNNLS